jgi:glycolate oxidase FAD binding subunit
LTANPHHWALADRAGGQLWLVSKDASKPPLLERGDYALIRRSDAETQLPAFSPLAPGLLTLSQRLKAQFDPSRILNPGRMFEEL